MKVFLSSKQYQSKLISSLKEQTKITDKTKKDLTPFRIDMGAVSFLLPRHFGFCYGVENAIEITHKAIEENPNKNIYLLGELIHNPYINTYFQERGVRFLMNERYEALHDLDSLTREDIVIIPAFGAPIWVEEELQKRNIMFKQYQSTCPFVEKVWNKAAAIAQMGYSIIIHGAPKHEETESTRSRIEGKAPCVIVKNIEEAKRLVPYIKGEKSQEEFEREFERQYSLGFDIHSDLKRIGVVNQTTMLASETQAIINLLKKAVIEAVGAKDQEEQEFYFAKTRDTLCYATNENQKALAHALQSAPNIDIAFAVGGHNSSNTSHLVEMAESKTMVYYIESDNCIIDKNTILRYDLRTKTQRSSSGFLDGIIGKIKRQEPVVALVFGGASCPDILIENVIRKIQSLLDL